MMAPKNEVVMEERRRLPPQKKWPTLLVRSLSDSAKYRRSAASGRNAHPILLPGGASTTTSDLVGSSACTASCCGSPVGVTKALTLSLSDSRLFSSQNIHNSSPAATTTTIINKRHHSSLLDIWSDKDPELCSCGCDQDLAEDDDDEEEEEDYSEDDEDEGCFVITSVPQSNEPEEVTNKASSEELEIEDGIAHNPNIITMVEAEDDMTRCIYIDSVDSGRSSDTGTHQSWTSSTSSTKSSSGNSKNSNSESSKNRSSSSNNNNSSGTASSSSSSSHGDPHNKVQIVNHNFCDYLGSVKRNGPMGCTVPKGSSAQQADKNNPGSAVAKAAAQQPNYASIQSSSCQNKVRVYVPYSTLIALTNEIRETPVDDIDEDDHDGDVVICDTQVILRINPDQHLHPNQETEIQYSTCKRNNRRMTRKLLNESETFHKITGNSVQGAAGTGANLNLPRRKDLCKLLGLNEQDVDLMIVPEVKIAQKVALSHSADLQTSRKQTAKKKDLAKFLGVEESISNNNNAAAADVDASINATTCTNNPSTHSDSIECKQTAETRSVSNNSVKSKDPQQRPKSLLINWGQMVKNSVKLNLKFEDSQNGGLCMEEDVPVQLRQLPAKEPERTNRKDLSKFLGFDDDSDSEEIVFIRNDAQPVNSSSSSSGMNNNTKPVNTTSNSGMISSGQSEQASINDSSLTRKSHSEFSDPEDSDDSVGSLRSFDSFVRRSLRCGASSEFAIQMEDMEANTRIFHPAQQISSGGAGAPKRGDVVCKQRNHFAVSPPPPLKQAGPRSAVLMTSASPVTPLGNAAAIAVCTTNGSANQRRIRRKIDAEKRAQEIQHQDPNFGMDSKIDPSLTTMDRKPLSSQSRDSKPRVMFGPNSRRMISPVRNKRSENKIPPVFRREEPLLVYPQKPPLFYQHYPPIYHGGFGILPPGGRINPNNGRIRVPRHPQRIPMREHPHPDY